MPDRRRFPTPWSVEEVNNACFVVRDANGISLAYCYYAEGPRLAAIPGSLTRDDAQRMAGWIARSPELANKPVP